MAAAMLLAATIVPHHHHDSVVCPMVELCDIDGQPNDEHTAHKSDRHGSTDGDCTFSAITNKSVVNSHCADAIVALPAQIHAVPRSPHNFITLPLMPEHWHACGSAAPQPQLRAPPLAIV